jgi:WS/DGAT/MGAT family acyltransferase
MLLRTHHAIGDGAALVKVIRAATESLGPPPPPPSAAAARRREPLDPAVIKGAALASNKLGQRFFRRGASHAPLTTPIIGAKQIAHLEPLDLRQLKEAGRETESTVNDVYLAAIAGALRAHVAGLGMAPVDLDVAMPVSVRDPGREGQDELGNRFGLVFARLPVATADRRARMERVTERTRAIKSTQEAQVVSGALSTMGHVPRVAQRAWVDAYIKDAVAVVTNVAGPAHPVALAGTPIAGMYLFVPSTGPIGLGISLLSYAGRGVVSLIADRATLPALRPFAAELDHELRGA